MEWIRAWSPAAFVGFGIPIIFLVCGSAGKKLVRGTPWEPKDFFLGVSLTLSTFSANMLFITEVVRFPDRWPGANLANAAGFAIVIFGVYLFLLTLHQDWEKQEPGKAQTLRLSVLSNLLATSLFAIFVFMIKGAK
jgi:hypothetical protein